MPKKCRPRIDFKKLGLFRICFIGSKGDRTKVFKKDGSLQKAFIRQKSPALGPSSKKLIAEDRDTIPEERQRLTEAENKLKQADAQQAKIEKETLELQELKRKTERPQAQIDAIEEELYWIMNKNFAI